VKFRLAPMTWDLTILTWVLLPLPLIVGAATLAVPPGRLPWLLEMLVRSAGYLVLAIYLWIWIWFRPTRFVVLPHVIEIVWPIRRRWLPRNEITAARVIDRQELKELVGKTMRVGAGGLWGAFGWLWTKKRGLVRMYISRSDRFVWIERGKEQPWLLTPERPAEFVRALAP
jgi:hypothetical protein